MSFTNLPAEVLRILGIHYFAPPVAVVASRRLAGIYRVLAARGAAIHLVTSGRHDLRPHEADYRHDFPLHPVEENGLREKLFGVKPAVGAGRKQSAVYRWLNRWRQSFPLLYLTDEGGPAYYRNALKKGRQLVEAEEITHLLSSYRPWVDHRIAARLKRDFPNLYWIADFRDLPVDQLRKDVRWPGWQRRIGKSIIRGADEVWVVSAGQAAQLANWHPNLKVVYNGLATDAGPPSETSGTDRFTINYTGSLYPGLQSVAPLAEALRTLLSEADDFATSLVSNVADPQASNKILLDYRGKDRINWIEWWEKSFPDHASGSSPIKLSATASVSVREARMAQRAATTNLLLSWSGPDYHGVLTAKLFDYLAAGRPITALVNGPDDPELRAIVEGTGAGRVFCHGQEEELLIWLRWLLANWRRHNGQLPWSTDLAAMERFRMSAQLKDLPSR